MAVFSSNIEIDNLFFFLNEIQKRAKPGLYGLLILGYTRVIIGDTIKII